MTLLPVKSMTVAPAGGAIESARTHAGNCAVANDERLVFARRRAGAVDDADMRERNDRRVDLDVRRERVLSLLPESSRLALFALRRVSP